MSIIGSNLIAGASGQAVGAASAYQISRSVRTRPAASGYFSRTFGAPTNASKFTWSGWVKRCSPGRVVPLFVTSYSGGESIVINAANQLAIAISGYIYLYSSAVLADPTAWYHIVVAADPGNATINQRMRVYVNGVELTSFSNDNRAAYTSYPYFNRLNVVHYIGYSNSYPAYADAYFAEYHFVDGEVLGPSSFGELSAATGVWSPKQYTGTYGNNGFYLNFSDNSAVGNLGYDQMGLRLFSPRGAGAAITTSSPQLFSNNVLQTSSGGAVVGSTTTFAPLSSDFTIEVAVRPTALGTRQLILYNGDAPGTTVSITLILEITSSGTLSTYIPGSSTPLSLQSSALLPNTWYQVAVVRSGGTGALYINGTAVASGSLSGSGPATSASGIYVGDGSITTSWATGMAGNIANLRLTVGVARYTSNYAAPTAAFPIGAADPHWAKVVALVPFSDTAGATSFATYWPNNWTPSNISLTSGTTYDSFIDVPTRWDDGGTGRGNYCALNPLEVDPETTISNGNLTQSPGGTPPQVVYSSVPIPQSGLWYADCKYSAGSSWAIGVEGSSRTASWISQYDGISYWAAGSIYKNGSFLQGVAAASVGDVIGVAANADTKTIQFYKNGAAVGSSVSYSEKPVIWFASGNYVSGLVFDWNFGQRPFAYAPPSGFKALNAQNLSAGTVTTGGTFVGNASTNGPFVWLNGVPKVMSINGQSVTFGTHVNRTAGGFKVITSNSSYNSTGMNNYSVTTTGDVFKYANAQVNP